MKNKNYNFIIFFFHGYQAVSSFLATFFIQQKPNPCESLVIIAVCINVRTSYNTRLHIV
jgi:hypothetical protein